MRKSVLWISIVIVLGIISLLLVIRIFPKKSIEVVDAKYDYQQIFIEGDRNKGHHIVNKSQISANEYADIIDLLDAGKFYYS